MHQVLQSRQQIEPNFMKKEVEIMDPLRRSTKASYLMDYETRTAFVEVANSAGL
jgi:glycerate kinase